MSPSLTMGTERACLHTPGNMLGVQMPSEGGECTKQEESCPICQLSRGGHKNWEYSLTKNQCQVFILGYYLDSVGGLLCLWPAHA